jgi:hypothetical protein
LSILVRIQDDAGFEFQVRKVPEADVAVAVPVCGGTYGLPIYGRARVGTGTAENHAGCSGSRNSESLVKKLSHSCLQMIRIK